MMTSAHTDALRIACRYLARDPLLHTDMTEALRRGLGHVVAAEETGVLLSVDEGYCGMLSCRDGETALRLLGDRSFPLLAIHQADQEASLCRSLGMETWMRCYQAVYEHERPPVRDTAGIRQLTGEHLDFLIANYRHEDSEYLAWRLERGALFGAFREGQLAGFIGKHAEGSMGLLEVLPAWRRRGIASSLESFLIAMELDRGNRPYCQLFTDNSASMALQKKLGLSIAEGEVIWLRSSPV
ncbi:MAG: GNAT family N-acetyltransferase [Oscillospiraceae bacterium]|nr:GNAT family N-acetyltransferase [Oscillospiraceae bacterium]